MIEEGSNVSFIDEYIDNKGKWIILYFYPKDFTSGCTYEAKSFNEKIDEFRKLNAEVIGVSVDSEESHKKFTEKLSLKFPLLSDEKRELVEKFGVNNAGKAKRTTFIIDPERKVRKVWKKVDVKKHVDEVLNYLKEVIG